MGFREIKELERPSEDKVSSFIETYDNPLTLRGLFDQIYRRMHREAENEMPESFLTRLEQWVETKNVPNMALINIKNLVTLYNIDTNLSDFKDEEFCYSLFNGYGNHEGGVEKQYAFVDGHHSIHGQYVNGDGVGFWLRFDDMSFATRFCTKAQWSLIRLFIR